MNTTNTKQSTTLTTMKIDYKIGNRDGSNVQSWFDNFEKLNDSNWNNFENGDPVYIDGVLFAEFNMYIAPLNRVYLYRDVTPDCYSGSAFIVGQTKIILSNVSKHIGYDKNRSACFFFTESDRSNIDEIVDHLARFNNVEQHAFNDILKTVSMNAKTVFSVQQSIENHHKKIAKRIVSEMISGDRGIRVGKLFFTFISNK